MNNPAMPAGAPTRALFKHFRPVSPAGRFLNLGLIALCLCLFGALVSRAAPPPDFPAHYPAWWSNSADSAQSVFLPGRDTSTEANYAPLNLGQLKWTATQAKLYLDRQLASVGGAKIDLDTLFAPMPPQGEPGSPARAAHDAAVAANYAPANLGQLKAVAKPFYDRLAAVGYSTRDYLRGKGYAADWTSPYPWNPEIPVEANYAVANLGQLKLVFGFDLAGFTPKDPEGGGGSDPDDPDPDDPGGDPNPADPNAIEDSDGDGFSDHVERSLGFDPKDPNSKPRPRYGIIDLGPMSGDEVPMLISEANGWVMTNKIRRWHKGVWSDQPLDVPNGISIGYTSISNIGPAGEIAVTPPEFGMEGYYFAADGSRVTTTARKNSEYGTYTFPYKFLEDGRTAYVCAGRGGDPYQSGGSVCIATRQIAICAQGESPPDVGGGSDIPHPGKCLTIQHPRAMSSGGTMIYDPSGWTLGVRQDESRSLYEDARGSVFAPSSAQVPVEDLVFYPETNLGSINSENILVGDAGGQPVWAKDGAVHELPQHPLLGATGRANYVNDMAVIAAEKYIWERLRDKDGNRAEPIAYDFPEKVAAVVDFNSGWTDGWKITGTNGAGQFIAIGYKIKEGQEKRTEKGELIIDHAQYTDAQGKPTGAIERHAASLVPAKVISIYFGDCIRNVMSDDQLTNYTEPSTPQWFPEKSRNWPIAYVRKKQGILSAACKFEAHKGEYVQMRARGPDGVVFGPYDVLVGQDGNAKAHLPGTLPDQIKYYDRRDPKKSFKLQWEFSEDGKNTWHGMGSTEHTVYLTWNTPQDPQDAERPRQESIFLIACRSADGLGGDKDDETLKQQVTEKVWGEFASRAIRRVDGKLLCYYDNYGTRNLTETKLVQDGDGQCAAWALLFLEARRVHGLDGGQLRKLVPDNRNKKREDQVDGFIIQKWDFAGQGQNGIWENKGKLEFGSRSYTWPGGAEVTYTSGTPGQSNPKPAALFESHLIAEVKDKDGLHYYDPSYGKEVPSIAGYDDDNVAGFYKKTESESSIVYLFRKNLPGQDLMMSEEN